MKWNSKLSQKYFTADRESAFKFSRVSNINLVNSQKTQPATSRHQYNNAVPRPVTKGGAEKARRIKQEMNKQHFTFGEGKSSYQTTSG